MCPSCGSFERHRLLALAIHNCAIPGFNDESADVLHFAPERILEEKFRLTFDNYFTANLFNDADLRLDIENIELLDQSLDIVIANHIFVNLAIFVLFTVEITRIPTLRLQEIDIVADFSII